MYERKYTLDRQTDRQDNYIARDATNIIKGVALVFMFVLHFYAMTSDVFSKYLRAPLQGCVCIFAFLTGYFYVFHKKKTFRYSLRKATDLWITYVFVFAIMLIIAISLHCYSFSIKNFILEILGIYRPTMAFCWYVDFYIVSICLLPALYFIIQKNALVSIVVGIFVPAFFVGAINKYHFPLSNQYLTDFLNNFFFWFPCIFIGAFFAEYKLFYRLFDKVFKDNIKNTIFKLIIYLMVLLFAFMGRYFAPSFNYIIAYSMDVIYTPLFVYALLNIIYIIPNYTKVLLPVSIIGKYSLPMWFLHGVFFNSCREYTQGVLYFPNNPILVVLWGLLLCLGVSILIMKPIKIITKWKNDLFFRKS